MWQSIFTFLDGCLFLFFLITLQYFQDFVLGGVLLINSN